MKKLFLVPARGGSKGLPRKNILPFAGEPLICRTLMSCKAVLSNDDVICVSTDDLEIKEVVEDFGVKVPFIRPDELSTDEATTEDVIRHALTYYRERNVFFDVVVVLQVTSPLRSERNILGALDQFSYDVDMVMSVVETKSNPYYMLFEEKNGFLKKSKQANFNRRQDCPRVWEANGAVYVINVRSLEKVSLRNFSKIIKYEMKFEESVDIDTELDFKIAEFLANDL